MLGQFLERVRLAVQLDLHCRAVLVERLTDRLDGHRVIVGQFRPLFELHPVGSEVHHPPQVGEGNPGQFLQDTIPGDFELGGRFCLAAFDFLSDTDIY